MGHRSNRDRTFDWRRASVYRGGVRPTRYPSRFDIRLSERQRFWLKAAADSLELTEAAVIRTAVAEYLQQRFPDLKPTEP